MYEKWLETESQLAESLNSTVEKPTRIARLWLER